MEKSWKVSVPVDIANAIEAGTGNPVTIDLKRNVTVIVSEDEMLDIALTNGLLIEGEGLFFEHPGDLERLHDLICEAGAREAADYLRHLFPADTPPLRCKAPPDRGAPGKRAFPATRPFQRRRRPGGAYGKGPLA